MDSDIEFGVFLGTRNKEKVRRERFKPLPATLAIREYDNTTEKNLLFIRTQGMTTAAPAAEMS
ncbi:hypothetical protein [Cryobacterium soli]|uniref:hypothetical protein n=1 Tax=Cryobacterium soli TaxID=2220095 RepID=UPI000E76D546|nr:hypothetical protein [Cryobacterium soli]